MDKNVIVVSVCLDSKKQALSTIPKRKIIKITKAMNSKVSKAITFDNVTKYEAVKDGTCVLLGLIL